MDPNRLSQEGSNFESKLVRSARVDVMPERSGRTILAGLGLAPSLAAASAAATTGAKLLGVKGVLVIASLGAAGALAVWGSGNLSETPTPMPPSAPKLEVRAPTPPRVIKKEEPVLAPRPVPDETPKAPSPAPRHTVSKKVDTLSLELEAIDEARSALAHGDHALASRLLDRYATRFPKPRLGAEATMLRIETLVARGDRAGAARLGKAFLKKAPNSPYERRVRSLIGETSGAP